MSEAKLLSETLFEEYLVSQGMTNFEFEKEWEGIPTHPDYTVYHNDNVYIFDVKEFEFQPLHPGQLISDNPCDRIRQKIHGVRNQFKYFKDKPCCLVLYTYDPMVELHDWTTMLGAMYGDFGVTMLFDTATGSAVPDSTKQAFISGGKMFRPKSSEPQNTTISALVTVRYVHIGQKRYQKIFRESLKTGDNVSPTKIDFDVDEKHLGVIVWENAFARIPFHRDMFSGFYDERWGLEGDVVTQVFSGESILAYRRLDETET